MCPTLGCGVIGDLVRDCYVGRVRSPEAASAWRSGGLELYQATVSQFSWRPHAHEDFFIALTESGLATPVYRGGKHVIGPGDMIVLNPEEAHAGGPPDDGRWSYRALYPSPDLVRQVTPAVPWFDTDVIRDPQVVALLHRFHRLSETAGSLALEREVLLSLGLGLLTIRHAAVAGAPRPPGREPRAIRLAKEHLDEHAADDVTLEDLASHTGLTPFHLCRVFRQATGMTPHGYQILARVRRARTLLLAGHSIATVAVETGFFDQAHLTRHFTRVMGLPPGQYVMAMRPALGNPRY
jgi:AraC-like DNA-binding protein